MPLKRSIREMPKPRRRCKSSKVLRGSDGRALGRGSRAVLPRRRASFTGEEVLELQLHGSVAVVNQVLRVAFRYDGLASWQSQVSSRGAHWKTAAWTLAQVEGLADLIEAETEAQRRQALRVLSGDLGKTCRGLASKISSAAAALIEATIDFVDEDVPVDVTPEVALALLEKTVQKKLRVRDRQVLSVGRADPYMGSRWQSLELPMSENLHFSML